MFLLDACGAIRHWTSGAETLFGYSEREVLGQHVAMLLADSDGANHLWLSATVLNSDDEAENVHREGRARRKDGSSFPADVSVSRLEVAGQVYLAALARDATQQRILEARLQQMHKMEAIGQLAGGIAHDFNNLLMIVAGCCEILHAQAGMTEGQRSSLDQIAAAIDQATTLSARLLTFSRRPLPERRVLDLNAALLQTGELLRRTIGEDIELDIRLYPRPLRTRIDATHVGQILINLAVNARDAMPLGGVFAVRTRPVTLDAVEAAERDVLAGDYILLDVSDDGPGMTAAVKARAFEPFFTTKAPDRGTGLGLACVHSIVLTSGGHIDLHTTPGTGVQFTILLPAAADDPDHDPSPLPPPRGDETVLVVEDEATVREIVSTMLRDLGYQTLEAGSVEEAIVVGERQCSKIDLLLTDMVMPDQTGRELAERLWEIAPALKVVFMSGHADHPVLTRGVERSEVAFLQKPFNRLALARRVREILDHA